ncbi:amidohydrolase family protein [Enterovirga sp. CN4-39]|uniref:amidohydrolase family protein n=1 Tax=Enterovirga sp. CN4-39 TaxID=3400910 RepID=UPI003C022D5A
MIVDCHAHVFRNWTESCGHPSTEIHLKYLQKIVTRPSAKVFRLRDGTPASAAPLFRKDDPTWEGLTDLAFRVGRYGQLQFTYEGEDYAVQYMPVGMQVIESPPEFMIAQMLVAEVDHCILQAGGGYGAMNDFNAFAQAQHPDRFSGLFWVDEATADREGTLAEIVRAKDKLGLKGLYYAQDHSRHGYARNLDHADFGPLWELIASMKVPVFAELSATPDYDRASYLANLEAFDRLLARMPDTTFVLVMGPPVGHLAPRGTWEFPAEALATYRRPNLLIEVMFPITWGGIWDYPYPEAQGLVREMRDLFGADKLVWGSDMPNVERFCTYKQSLDYVRRYCDFLSGSEKDRILGLNAAELMGLR